MKGRARISASSRNYPLRLAALALSLSLSAAGARRAEAESPADVAAARQLFREGSQLSQEGKWEQARQRFEQSLQLRRAAITLYSLGIAQKQTGQLLEALESLRAFTHWPPNEATDPYQPIARELVAELERRVGKITLRLSPEGAPLDRLEIDGVKLGDVALEVPRLVNPGKHELLAVASDGREGRARFELGEGKQLEIKVDLAPARGDRAGRPSGSPQQAGARAAPSAGASPPAGPRAEGEGERSRAVPVALLAGGGALAAGGAVVGWLGLSQAKDAVWKGSDEASAAKTKALVGDVMMGTGLIAAGVGAYLLLHGSTEEPSPTSARVSPWVSPGMAGLTGRF